MKVDSAEKYRGKRHDKKEEKQWSGRRKRTPPMWVNPILLANALHSPTHAKYAVTKATLKHSVGTMMTMIQKKEDKENNTVMTVTQEKEDKEKKYLPSKSRKRVETVRYDEHSSSFRQ